MNRLSVRSIFCLLTLSLCINVVAAPKKSVPLKVEGDTIVVVKSLPCKIVAPEGATIYDWSVPGTVTAESNENILTITKAPKGEFKVYVRTLIIDFDKKQVIKDVGEILVNYGGVEPGPTPPVPPDDPLVKSLKGAYVSDKGEEKAKHMEAFAALFRQAAKMDLSSIKTVGELYNKLTAASRLLLPVGVLLDVRKITGEQMKTVLGDTTAADFTVTMKQQIVTLFAKLGDSLTEAMK